MPFKRDLIYCFPFRFSNDRWTANVVGDLHERLQSQTTPAEESAALVVGSGGLPYLLGTLRASRIFVVDLHQTVLDNTKERVDALQDHETWDDYHTSFLGRIGMGRFLRRAKYRGEQVRAAESGLQGDYTQTRQQAAESNIEYIRSDVRDVAGRLGELAAADNLSFTFVNFTNIANYMANGREELNDVLSVLPMASDAVVVDSSRSLLPAILDQQTAAAHMASL